MILSSELKRRNAFRTLAIRLNEVGYSNWFLGSKAGTPSTGKTFQPVQVVGAPIQ
jgi:hypothetical protein